jgi:hypothetical protein
VRERFVEEGLEAALTRHRPRTLRLRKLDGEQEARLIALVCSPPEEGQECWTLQLLANKLVELHIVESIARETIRQVLKKRTQALAHSSVVHSAQKQCRVCVSDGRGAERVYAALR